MADVEVYADNTGVVVKTLKHSIITGLTTVGMVAEGYAKRLCPVDTGRLRNSITNAVVESEKAVYIGTNVEYAPYVELGTRRQEAQPFLKPAAQDHASEYRQILRGEIGG